MGDGEPLLSHPHDRRFHGYHAWDCNSHQNQQVDVLSIAGGAGPQTNRFDISLECWWADASMLSHRICTAHHAENAGIMAWTYPVPWCGRVDQRCGRRRRLALVRFTPVAGVPMESRKAAPGSATVDVRPTALAVGPLAVRAFGRTRPQYRSMTERHPVTGRFRPEVLSHPVVVAIREDASIPSHAPETSSNHQGHCALIHRSPCPSLIVALERASLLSSVRCAAWFPCVSLPSQCSRLVLRRKSVQLRDGMVEDGECYVVGSCNYPRSRPNHAHPQLYEAPVQQLGSVLFYLIVSSSSPQNVRT